MTNNLQSLPVVYPLLLVDVAANWQVKPEELLSDLGLTREMLLDPQRRISFDDLNKLIIKAGQLTQEAALAIYFGQKMQISMHGFVGFAALTAANVREALMIAERFVGMISSIVNLRLEEGTDESAIYLEMNTQLQPLREVAVLAVMFGFAHMGQAATGQLVTGRAELDFPPPSYLEPLIPFLPAQVSFNQAQNRIIFPSSYLDLPLVMANPVASQIALTQCEQELQRFGLEQPFIAQVKALMFDEKYGFSTLEQVAQRLHMSERTLKRQLAKYDVTYTDLVEDTRKQKALDLLANPKLSLEDISEHLGYSDMANFTRAFKRWTEQTPAAYRKSLGKPI
ncbi:AraC family transcriptional regulator [Agitococcus lubricus]|uniref:Helix-turn-helix protein n=1 Tax=Agitococcus lubricus TaxID=1077255 RepID=A0A2T5J3J4_9GAMM|nr:AraC family transcriptional regulator [Agitococcus lubricus]PTQ91108.1 helix-turn-helix protein [Agitococcus lubricus]